MEQARMIISNIQEGKTPVTEQYTRSVSHSLNNELAPYREDKELFANKVRQIFNNDKFSNALINSKGKIGAAIYSKIVYNIGDDLFVITPWRVEQNKQNIGIQLEKNTLSVIVIINDTKQYIHELTEALTAGILTVLHLYSKQTNNKFILYLLENYKNKLGQEPIAITIGDIIGNYLIEKPNRYRILIGGLTIYSDNIDFIRGIITGSRWLNINHHDYITEIRDPTGQIVTF